MKGSGVVFVLFTVAGFLYAFKTVRCKLNAVKRNMIIIIFNGYSFVKAVTVNMFA